MSIYESLGETAFSITDPTISRNPPFKYTRAIAYNGSYWLAAGTVVVRSVTKKSFSAVKNFEDDAYYYDGQIIYAAVDNITDQEFQNKKNLYLNEKQKNLDLAKVYFNEYVDKNYVPQTYTHKTIHCFAKSTDGYNWKYVEQCPIMFNSVTSETSAGSDNANKILGLAWNGTKWMAVGKSSGQLGSSGSSILVLESSDGETWDITGAGGNPRSALRMTRSSTQTYIELLPSEMTSVACDTSKWIVGGDNGLWKKGFSETSWTFILPTSTFPVYSTKYTGIATDGTNWVATGEYNSSGGGTPGNAAAIVSSTNGGSTWVARLIVDMYPESKHQKFKAVAWNGDKWIAVGLRGSQYFSENLTGVIAVSEDGVDWEVIEGFSTGLSCVTWDGNEWFVGSTNSNVLVSKDGYLWREVTGDTSGVLTIATPIVLPIIGGDLNTVKSLLIGNGNPASVIRTYNNSTWISQVLTDDTKFFRNKFSRNFYGVVWGGNKWVIVGEADVTGRSIAVSTNGIDWTYPSNTLTLGKSIAYGDSKFVAVGNKLITSSDTETWTERTSPIKNLFCVAYNGTLWVAGGDNGVQYSSNGTIWTKSTTCPLKIVRGVAWNGYYWVGTGKGSTHSIMLSKDGMRWYFANANSVPFTEGFSVAWNQTRWLAVGNGTLPIAVSTNGYDWESIPPTSITNGQYVAWTGSKWLVSGYGSSPVIASTDTITWTDYSILLTKASCFATNDFSLPITGTSSSTVLDAANLIVADLTTKTNATIVEEEEAAKLAADLVAQAAALEKRNAIKSKATEYLTRAEYWKNTSIEQFEPFKDKQYVDMSNEYPYEYTNLNSIVVKIGQYYTSALTYKNRVYDDNRTQEQIEFDLDNLVNAVKLCEEDMDDFYNVLRVLYSTFAGEIYTAVTSTSNTLTKIEDMEFPEESNTTVTTFYNLKKDAYEVLKDEIVSQCSTQVTTITYPNTATDYAALFKTLFAIENTFTPTYTTDDTNPYLHLVLMNTMYSRIHPRKIECDALVTAAYDDAVKWSTLLEVTAPTLQSIKDEFAPLYTKYFRTINSLFFYPETSFDTATKFLNTTDLPVRAFKALADQYKHPLAYPSGVESLYNRLKTTTDSVESTRQAAIDYMINKRKTTLKVKLDDIFSVTKTKYIDTLSLDTHLTKVNNIVYSKDSNYTFCIDLLKKLKNTYVFGSNLKEKIFAIPLGDIAAEEDGCTPPTGGWGTSPRSYAIFDFSLDLGLEFTTILSPGTKYLIGEEIIIPGTSFKGVSPTNDIKIKVLDVGDFDGRIVRFSSTGTFPSQSTSYTNLVGSRFTNGSANFNVTPGASTYTISLLASGTGYIVGQKLNLPGSLFKRKSPQNDILISITGVNGSGEITTFTSSGSPTVSTFDDIPGYKNISASFTFLQGLPGLPNGKNFMIVIADGGVSYKVNDILVFEGRRFAGLSPVNDIVITVTAVNSSGTITDFTYSGTPSTTGTYGFTLNPYPNNSATFTFSNITGGSNYTCAIKNGGSKYRVGDRLFITGTSFTGATSPTNDFMIKVNSVSSTGAILTFSVEGSFSFLFQQFSASGYVFEQNAVFNVIANYYPSQTYTVSLVSGGDGYSNGETITIPGSLVGGGEDVTITVTGTTGLGVLSTFTNTGTPNTKFRIKTNPLKRTTAPYVAGRYGNTDWEKYNNTYHTRDNLASYMFQNSINSTYGTLLTFKTGSITLSNSIRWRDLLNFVKNTTYDTIVDAIEELEDKVDDLNSNSELTEAYVDNLVTADLATIQSKYAEYATTYTQSLLDSVNEIITSAKFKVVKSSTAYTVTLVNAGYGYDVNEDLTFVGADIGGTTPTNNLVLTVKTVGTSGQILTFVKKSGTAASGTGTYVVTNNKLSDRFSQISSAQSTIETNYSTLYNAPGSIVGKTNQEIATIVTNAITAKNAINAIQDGEYPSNIQKAITYLKYYKEAKEKVLQYEDDITRWIRMKRNAYINSPFDASNLSNGIGEPFIMSIPPTNTDYWIPRKYTLYSIEPDSDTIYECTLNEQTGKVETSFSALNISDITEYSPNTLYTVGTYAKYNDTIYVCTKDNTASVYSLNPPLGVKGLSPLVGSDSWVERKYPYVFDGNREIEFNPSMSSPIDPELFNKYNENLDYKLGTIVKYENASYIVKKTIDNDGYLKGVDPTNTTYWRETTYPTVYGLTGIKFEAKPELFSPVNASTLTNVFDNNVYKAGDFSKTTVTFVDDEGYYRSGTFTFQLDQDLTTSVSKGYAPVFSYTNGDKYQNYLMWEYVQSGTLVINNNYVPTYSSSGIYKRNDYVAFTTGSFFKQDGTTISSGTHTFKLISSFPATTSTFVNSNILPFYKTTSNFPIAIKVKGVLPTATPWTSLGLSTLSNTEAFYSSDTEYNLNDIVKYTVDGSTYRYKFVGTIPKYEDNTTVYIYFGKVSGNKNPWGMRSYPAVYYNNTLVEPAPGNIPQLNVNDYLAYDSSTEYSEEMMVKYNNKVYTCGFSKVQVLHGVPVSNEEYWSNINYKLIQYNDEVIEAAPNSVPTLNSDDYDEYDSETVYQIGDIVKITNTTSTLNVINPTDVITDKKGNIYVLDKGNKVIKKVIINIDDSSIVNIGIPNNNTKYAFVNGNTTNCMYTDSLGSITIDKNTDTIYFADNNVVRKITTNGTVSTVAGYEYEFSSLSGYVNATGTQAKFGASIKGIIFDTAENCLYVADTSNNAIRKVTPEGVVTTFAGKDALVNSSVLYLDGTGTNARFNAPTDLDVDPDGNVYVADTGNNCIRKITPEGVVTTLAGDANQPAGFFNSTGQFARFNSPRGIAVNKNGHVFVADMNNHRIREVTPSGTVTTFSGTGVEGFLNGSDNVAKFRYPSGLSIDQYDNVYVADSGNNQVRKVRSDGRVISAVKNQTSIHECVAFVQTSNPIKNIPPTNTNYWQSRSYPLVYVNNLPYQANPNNTTIFKELNQYDYHRYDNNWMYKFGDLTSYNGKVYQCINAIPVGTPSATITNIPPTNILHWKKVENDESILEKINNWISGSTYYSGDVVRYLNSVFKCTNNHVASTSDLPNRPPKWVYYPQFSYRRTTNWQSGVQYALDDIVVYNGKQYICKIVHTSSSLDSPTRDVNWVNVNQITAANVLYWDLNVQYLVGTNVVYNGYFYKCEVEHYSTYTDSPYSNKYYWTKVSDLTKIGIPSFYDSEESYTLNNTISLRVKNNGLKKHADDNYTVEFYKCIKTDPDYPYEYTYDTLAVLDSKNNDGNYEYGKVKGSWNISNTPRYGTPDRDPFAMIGFAAETRRRVWMEIEMPYRRLEPLETTNQYITSLGITETMSRLFPFVNLYSGVIHPTDYTTDYDFIKDKLETVVEDFIDTEVGTGVDKLTIKEVIENAYDYITRDLVRRRKVPYVINTDFDAIGDGDENKCVAQLIEEINVIKTQYFYLPSTQKMIFDDPYAFMNPIALAQIPPQKLFKDLGVGDFAQIQASVNQQEEISTVSYNPDGTITFSYNYNSEQVAPLRRYTRADLEYTKNRTALIENKLELVSISCFEAKQKIGFGAGVMMLADDTKMGARFICDSGRFDLPIGEYNVLSNYGIRYNGVNEDATGLMNSLTNLLNTSMTQPEYTLPTSQATRDLAVITYESKNPIVKGLSSLAKGVVGTLVCYSAGLITGIADICNAIASVHAAVLTAQGKEVDAATLTTIEITTINTMRFNQNDDSIGDLLDMVKYYKDSIKTTKTLTEEETEDLINEEEKEKALEARLENYNNKLTRLNLLLWYVGLFFGETEFEMVERTIRIPPPVEVPLDPRKPRAVQKPTIPENRALQSLTELQNFKQKLLIEKINLENALALNLGHPPLPEFVQPIPERMRTQVQSQIDATISKEPEYIKFQKQINGFDILVSAQNTTILENTEALPGYKANLLTAQTNFSYMDTLRTDMNKWIGPPKVTPDRTSVTVGNQTYNPSTMTDAELKALNNRVLEQHNIYKTDVFSYQSSIAAAEKNIADAKSIKSDLISRREIEYSKQTNWISQWKAKNPNQSASVYIEEGQEDFDKRLNRYEQEKNYHEARCEELKQEHQKNEMRRKANIRSNLELNQEELDRLNQELTDKELENKAIQIENDRNIMEYQKQLDIAEAEERAALKNYREAYAKYESQRSKAKYANEARKRQYNLAVEEAFNEADEYLAIYNQKKQVTAIKYIAFEEVVTEYHITGNLIQKIAKNAVVIPLEILATLINLSTGIGEVPYRVEQLITGKYFYNKLPAAARARIDLISDQLTTLPDKMGNRLKQVIGDQLDAFKNFINSRRKLKTLMKSNPRLAKSGFGTIFAGKTGRRAARCVSSIIRTAESLAGGLGNKPGARFLAGVGFMAEIAGAVVGAWQGGAYTEAATLENII